MNSTKIMKRTDDEAQAILAHYRALYCDGPVGKWGTSLNHLLGSGFDGTGLYWATIEFRPDGTGTLLVWSALKGEDILNFRWEKVSSGQIAIFADEEEFLGPDVVSFDFFMLQGCDQVLLHQTDYAFGDEVFWDVYGTLRLL